MKKIKLFKELDILKNAMPFFKHLKWKFKRDPEYDKNLIDWFINEGEIRAVRKGTNRYAINLRKGLVNLYIGIIGSDSDKRKNQWVNEHISYFWRNNKNLAYCTNNLLKTVEEIQTAENIIWFDEKNIKYSDNSIGDIYFLSKDNYKNFLKYKNKLIDILNSSVNWKIKDPYLQN